MVTINIWLPEKMNVGHSSLEINCRHGTNSRYISWWPTENNILKTHRGGVNFFEADVKEEGALPNMTWYFDLLDEAKIAEWWDDFLASGKNNYNLISTNCSWAVIKALRAGGSDSKIPWTKFATKYNIFFGFPDLSNILYKYSIQVYKTYRYTSSTAMALKRPLIDIADEYSSVWSPTDVNSYCEILEKSVKGEKNPFKTFKSTL
jgi:hypothetical protein